MAEFHRALAKQLGQATKLAIKTTTWQPTPRWQRKSPTIVRTIRRAVLPYLFKYVIAPRQRFQMAHDAYFCRIHGLMLDDTIYDKLQVIERAIELLPYDMRVARYRRFMRAQYLSMIRQHLPIEDQNYDPFIPYLAPFIEEAKFQFQEEEELLGFHQYDRRFFTGNVTGLGELDQYSKMSSALWAS